MLQKANFAVSRLANSLSSSATQLSVTAGQGARFPQTGNFMATLWSNAYSNPADAYWAGAAEIVQMTLSSGDTFNIIRAQEPVGATALAFNAGDHVDHVMTAGTWADAVMPAGTSTVFYQAAAPTGWTQSITHNDKALRVVSGAGGGAGGTYGFSSSTVQTAYADLAVHTHSITDTHQHAIKDCQTSDGQATGNSVYHGGTTDSGTRGNTFTTIGSITVNAAGNSSGHVHTLSLLYIDVILCSKN